MPLGGLAIGPSSLLTGWAAFAEAVPVYVITSENKSIAVAPTRLSIHPDLKSKLMSGFSSRGRWGEILPLKW